MATMNIEIKNVSSVGISCICYSPQQNVNHLAVGSWDNKLRIYDTDKNNLIFMEDHGSPILGNDYLDSRSGAPQVVAAGLDGCLALYDVAAGQRTPLGSHQSGVRCVSFHAASGLIYSGGWDGHLKAWDPRSPTPVASTTLNGKIFTLDTCANRLVAVDSGKTTYIFDLLRPGLDAPLEHREQILKFQTRKVKCFHDGSGFISGSIEGRVAWEYFDQNPAIQARKYVFKCHRVKDASGEVIHPVHSLAVHPRFGTFATGGGDGGVSVWDGFSKKRIWRLPTFRTSIADLAFNSNGDQLAIAASHVFEDENKDQVPSPQLFVRSVGMDDVKPKGV